MSNDCKIIELFKESEKWYHFKSSFGENILSYISDKKGNNEIENYENFLNKFFELEYFNGFSLKRLIRSFSNNREDFIIAELNTV